jgi:uncharacterized surface protein with fasciclin (FAS1) repeats
MQKAMIKGKYQLGILFLVFTLIVTSCDNDDFDKYAHPEWLEGKLYTQMKDVDNLSTFTRCVELVKYDEVIDVSGSFTVFAPTNEAFDLYFQQHPQYNSVDDIPLEELDRLVKFHIVQNQWSREQLTSLDVNGWIDIDDPFNDKPRGFKRETVLMTENPKFGIKDIGVNTVDIIVVDTTETGRYRYVARDSRKFAPLFYQEYFAINELLINDYSFYFERSFDDPRDLYYVNAKIVGDEIFSENGFIYFIDRVVEPLSNADELLRDGKDEHKYNKFLDLVNHFVEFEFNPRRTYEQAGVSEGLEVDSLFDISYPQLAFDIVNERTKTPSGGMGLAGEVSVRFHHGLVAPTNRAFDEFVSQYIQGGNQWGSVPQLPKRIKKIVANSYFSEFPVYESDLTNGFINGEQDIVRLNPSDIVQKEFGSNSTFLGVDKAIVPRAFSSITGPIYRQRGYSIMMNAIEYTGLLPALKREGQDYALFAVNDITSRTDSSLIHTFFEVNEIEYEFFEAITLAPELRTYRIDENNLRLLLLNQVAIETPRGNARKEFLQTMAGNHIIWDNETGYVKGTSNSNRGYHLGPGERIDIEPRLISDNADNGETYEVNGWFNFSTSELYGIVSINFTGFHELLVKAGLANPNLYRYNFLSQTQVYTIFAPSNQALEEIQADTLSGKNLERFLKLHFIEGDLIFTDGRKQEGYYKTKYDVLAPDGRTPQPVHIYLRPQTDEIVFRAKQGGNFASVEESAQTNRISARSLRRPNDPETLFPNIISTAVIHGIDKALDFEMLDTK